MRISSSAPLFGTRLVWDDHEMTRKERAKFNPAVKDGLARAERMLAVDGNDRDTLTVFYADDMVGQSTTEPNYLGFELNKAYPPETKPVFTLHRMTNANQVVQTVLEAYWKLKNRVH